MPKSKPKSKGAKFPREIIAQTREIFHAVYPQAFAGKGDEKQPLKIGIYQDLISAFPDIKRRLLHATLNDYTSGPTYHRNVIAGAARIGLDGYTAGHVEADHEAYSKKRLAGYAKFEKARAKRKLTQQVAA